MAEIVNGGKGKKKLEVGVREKENQTDRLRNRQIGKKGVIVERWRDIKKERLTERQRMTKK